MMNSTNRPVLMASRVLLVLVCVLVGGPVSLSLGGEIWLGVLGGLAFAAVIIQIEVLSDGFSFRHFANGTIGLLVGLGCAWLVTSIEIFEIGAIARFENAEEVRDLVNLALYVAFGFLGVALAVRAPREEFSLLIPYVRFLRQSSLEQQLVVDQMTLSDGRLPAVIDSGFLGGEFIVARSAVEQIQLEAESDDELLREPARAALDAMEKLGQHAHSHLRIVEAPSSDQTGSVDRPAGRVLALAHSLGVPVLTVDPTVERLAIAQGAHVLSLAQLTLALRPELKPGDTLRVTLSREGKESHQAVGYLGDGSMVVVNEGAPRMGERVGVRILSLMPTAAGRMVFAELDPGAAVLEEDEAELAAEAGTES